MALIHRCKCGSTVFTLEAPRSVLGNARINTGIKLATCMQCGSQDRPEDTQVNEDGKVLKQTTTQYPVFDYERKLRAWLRCWNYYSKGESDDDYHRREWEDQRAEDWGNYRAGKF